jgi:hypothetical protein
MSSEPSGDEAVLFEYVIRHSAELPKRSALGILCGASRRWESSIYWERSVGAFAGGKSDDLSLDEVKDASSLFGFGTVAAACVSFLLASNVMFD